MAKCFEKCVALRFFLAAAFVLATLHGCHSEHAPNATSVLSDRAQLTAESCPCGDSHETGCGDHRHCSCVCHVPSALVTVTAVVFDAPAAEVVKTVFFVKGFDHVNRVERPPRLA